MPKTLSPAERSTTTLTFFVGLAMFAIFFLAVGYYYLFKEVKMLRLNPAAVTPVPQATITSVTYDCDQKKTIQATYLNNTVELDLSDGRSAMLMQGVSGSGIRYVNSDETLVFWSKGDTAFIEEKGVTTFKDCVTAASPSP